MAQNYNLTQTGEQVQGLLNQVTPNTQDIVDLKEGVAARPTTEQVAQMVVTALQNYSTTSEMQQAITDAVVSALSDYSTTAEMNTAITAAITSALANYSTTAQMNTAIATAVAQALVNYYTKSETDAKVSAEAGRAQSVEGNLQQLIISVQQSLVNYYLKTETYSKTEVNSLIDAVKQFEYVIAATLPTATADTMGKIYLIPSTDPKTQNVKDEYITIFEGSTYKWEQIGSTAVDLSGYSTTAEMNAAIAQALTAYYTKAQVDSALAGKQDVLTFDNTPTANSTNPVTSGGVKGAIDTESARAAAAEQGLQDEYDSLYALYEAASFGEVVPVAYNDWPLATLEEGKVYRVANSATPTAYSDYMYDGTNTILMATFSFPGVDDEPVAGSNNLVKSGGVYNAVDKLEIKRLDETSVTSKWTKIYSSLPAGTTIYYRIHSLIPGVTNIAFSKNFGWTTQNILLILPAATTPRYGSITLDSVSDFGLLFYSVPSTYAGLNIEVSLNPMYGSLMGEINKVKDNTLMIMDNNNVHNYFTPIFKNFKAGTKIYTYLKSLPDNVTSGQIALTKTNAWTTDSILAGAISLGKTVEYTLTSDCDVNLRFYNSNLSSFDGLELWISLSPIYNQIENVSEYVGYEEYKETTIVVDINGSGAFTSIREAVKSISDATIDNRYNVFVKNGTYNEIDIVTKSWVNITGESKDGVIVVTDGKSTSLSPSDYHFGSYANTPINEIPVEYKHLLWHCSNSVVSNMTMIVNDCKYVVHQDESAGAFVAVVKDCVLKRLEETTAASGNLVGCGLRHGEYVEYIGCDFITEAPNMDFIAFSTAIYWHNLSDDNGSCGVKMKDCNVFNCHIMTFYDIGAPTQKNEIVIDNVQSDSSFYGVRIFGTDGVAFKTKVIIKNCKPNFLFLTEEISDYFKMALNPYTMSVCQVNENIVKGQPLSVNKYGSIVPIGVADSGEDFVLALEDLASGDLGYVNTGIAGLGLAEAGNYQSGDKLYINNGKFTKIAHGDAVAFVLFNKQQDSDGLIIICKDV